MPDSFTRAYISVGLILEREGRVLVGRRCNTGWLDGQYGIPAGHVERNETICAAMAREAQEEVGIEIAPHELHVVHVMHRLSTERIYVDFFLTVRNWVGEPRIAEPHKCDDLRWCLVDALPNNTIGSIRQALECCKQKIAFSEYVDDALYIGQAARRH